jgi:hypothetical protein
MNKVQVAGVNMVKFAKPGQSEPYRMMASRAIRGAVECALAFGFEEMQPGGLMSKGHPLGATGLAQCYELVNQLRHNAGHRQVPEANIALQHNLGLGGAAVVTMYRSL